MSALRPYPDQLTRLPGTGRTGERIRKLPRDSECDARTPLHITRW